MLWLGAAAPFLLLFVILFLVPSHTSAENPSEARLAFTGSTSKPLRWVEMCLAKDWGGRLSLRHRRSPQATTPTARLDNPALHYVVDVIDHGSERIVKAYSRRGKPFSDREREALNRCLTGAE